MSELSEDGLALHGGCYCSAVRFKIDLPPLPDRPILLPAQKNKENRDVRPPIISFDHCNDCRRAGGSIVPAWFICPQSWVTWSIPISQDPFPIPEGSAEGHDVKGGERIKVCTEDFIQRPQILEGFITHFNSSPDTWRTFCTRCGTNLTYVCLKTKGAGKIPMLDIFLGSLDRESLESPGVRPDRHFYWKGGIEWIRRTITDGDAFLQGKPLPRHPEFNRHVTV